MGNPFLSGSPHYDQVGRARKQRESAKQGSESIEEDEELVVML